MALDDAKCSRKGKEKYVPSGEHVLHNLDLLDLIFSFLDNTNMRSGPKYDEKRQNLLSAALACKVFFDPAMDRLWRYLYTLRPLLRIVPTIAKVGARYVATRAITKENVDRLYLYAKRVRYLALDDVDEAISPHIFYAIHHMHKDSCLFSTLSTFGYYFEKEREPFDFPSFSLFAGPALSAITIHGILEPQEVVVASFLHDVYSTSEGQNLRELELKGQLSAITLEYIQKFDKLRSLTLITEDAEATALVALFKMFPTDNALQHLSLQINNKNTAYIQPTFELEHARFNNLKSLSLFGFPGLISKILEAVRTKELVSLKISFKGKNCNHCRGDIIECVKKVVFASALKSLQSIHLQTPYGSIPWDAFALLRRPGLQYAVDIHVKIDHFSMQSVYALVQNNPPWQYLEVLTLLATEIPLPLMDLWEIRTLCPTLKKLSISVAACLELPILQEMERRSHVDCYDHGLQDLDLLPLFPVNARRDTSRCDDVAAVIIAGYIDHLFSCLKKTTIHLEDIDRRSCGMIEDLIKQLRASRV